MDLLEALRSAGLKAIGSAAEAGTKGIAFRTTADADDFYRTVGRDENDELTLRTIHRTTEWSGPTEWHEDVVPTIDEEGGEVHLAVYVSIPNDDVAEVISRVLAGGFSSVP